MASIRAETGRHIWKRRLLKEGSASVPGIMCDNCRAYRIGEDPDRPVTGCLTDIDVSRCGESRLKDYQSQEMARRLEQDDAERAADLELLQEAGVLELDGRLRMG